MLVQLTKAFAGITMAAILATGGRALGQEQPAAQAQQKQQKNYKDRAEYDLFASITKETNPQKRLELLNTWRDKYPTSDFKPERLQLFMVTYQALNQGQKMLDTAKEIVELDANNIGAMFWISLLTPSLHPANAPAEVLATAEKAAKGVLSNIDAAYAPEKKAPNVPEDAWKKERMSIEGTARATLGWVEWQRKNLEAAEAQLVKSLATNPQNGTASGWLGTVLLQQRKIEKQSAALYHIARAASYDGPGAADANTRKQLEAYLQKAYNQHHGSTEGLAELKAKVKTEALPPADFKIKTAVEIAEEKEKEFRESNPMLALWMSIKKELAGPNGDQYFADNVKNAHLPGGAMNVQKFKGWLISHKPAKNPTEIVLGIADQNSAEVTLKMEKPLYLGKADPGTVIEFAGVASEFSREPFNLTLEIEKKEDLVGWPAPPPPAKKAVTKKGAKKK